MFHFTRQINFHKPVGVKIKPESELSCHITLPSLIGSLFYARLLYFFLLGLVTHGVRLAVKLSRQGLPTAPADILAEAGLPNLTVFVLERSIVQWSSHQEYM